MEIVNFLSQSLSDILATKELNRNAWLLVHQFLKLLKQADVLHVSSVTTVSNINILEIYWRYSRSGIN